MVRGRARGRARAAALLAWLPLLLIGLIGAGLAGCATNPVTGRPQLALMSEAQEIRLGREAAPEIARRYGGAYDDPALQAYVREVGQRLAAVSHRPQLVYHFTVLDSPEVNAFSLPGGYVFIARGLLAYLNDEAELAGVLGHEIGHVTARHAVRQYSAAQAARLLYGVGSLFLPELRSQAAQDLFNVLGTAWLRGYGREMELEADRLGAEYLARAGYDPRAMLRVIELLKDQEELERRLAKEEGRPPRVYHGIFATHPSNDRRLQELVRAAQRLRPPGRPRPVSREAFLPHLEGLAYGDSYRSGVRRGHRFYHGPLGFALSFPEGWRVENRPDLVLARSPEGDALLALRVEDLNRRMPPEAFMRQRLGLKRLERVQALEGLGKGASAGASAVAWMDTPFGRRPAWVAVVYLGERAYVFLGAVRRERDPRSRDALFAATARSLHALSGAERALAQPLRIRLHRARAGETFARLARGSPLGRHAEELLRLLNGLWPDREPTPGLLLKLVR